jgi:hypothetical protein
MTPVTYVKLAGYTSRQRERDSTLALKKPSSAIPQLL